MVDRIDELVRTDFRAIDKREELRVLIGWLRGEAREVPIICDGRRPYGVLNERSILNSQFSPAEKIERHVTGVPVLAPGTAVVDASQSIAENRVPFLPVGTEKGATGYVRAVDLIRKQASLFRGSTAEQLLVPVPIIDTTATMSDVIHHMRKAVALGLPVVNPEGVLSGVVRFEDAMELLTDARRQGRRDMDGNAERPRFDAVADLVDGTFQTVSPTASLQTILAALEEDDTVIVADAAGHVTGALTAASVASSLAARTGGAETTPSRARR
ncbi:MAG: CBS domain-containing protein [Thermoplasmatota archaeon]